MKRDCLFFLTFFRADMTITQHMRHEVTYKNPVLSVFFFPIYISENKKTSA